jgi:hypothetical protein
MSSWWMEQWGWLSPVRGCLRGLRATCMPSGTNGTSWLSRSNDIDGAGRCRKVSEWQRGNVMVSVGMHRARLEFDGMVEPLPLGSVVGT